jgi:hypothetical protein
LAVSVSPKTHLACAYICIMYVIVTPVESRGWRGAGPSVCSGSKFSVRPTLIIKDGLIQRIEEIEHVWVPFESV